jgi:hypothetical protein
MWEVFSLPGVQLATSWYSDDRDEHRAITGRDTWRQTRANITEAQRRGIPLHAGIIDGIVPGQRAAEGERALFQIGVRDTGTDTIRQFGRGTVPDASQACGHCGRGRAAVLPDGTVTPCPMTRWMAAGSVREAPLADILGTVTELAATLPRRAEDCAPTQDDPNITSVRTCKPTCIPDSYCNPLCTPGACKPRV